MTCSHSGKQGALYLPVYPHRLHQRTVPCLQEWVHASVCRENAAEKGFNVKGFKWNLRPSEKRTNLIVIVHL